MFIGPTKVRVAPEGPCDILDAAPEGAPCVAAHSTVRALYGAYTGPLYAVKRASDNAVSDIAPLSPGGYANSGSQDAFCAGSACVIWMIYDQTKHRNHLGIAPRKDGAHHIKDLPCNATRDKLTVGGHPVYSAYFEGGMGYRIDNSSGIAVHDQAETMYMVTSGVHYNARCCFDYGNAETNNRDDGAGTMEAVYFGSAKGGLNHGGAGTGPWYLTSDGPALPSSACVLCTCPALCSCTARKRRLACVSAVCTLCNH